MLQIDEYQKLVTALIKASDPIEPDVVTCVCRVTRTATVVTSRAEQYRQLARECRQLAESLPPGDSRTSVLDMAEEWERLADQQERATDLRQGKPSR